MKGKYRVKDNKMVHTSWENDKGQTEIYSEQEQKEMMKWVDEISASEDNRGFLHCLIIAMPKKKYY